jgi:hypothetical protein
VRFFALLACFAIGSAYSKPPEPAKVRVTTWNLEWFPNGSSHDAPPEVQAQAQAAWSEPWKSMNGVDPPRGFAFAWFKIGNADIGVYAAVIVCLQRIEDPIPATIEVEDRHIH